MIVEHGDLIVANAVSTHVLGALRTVSLRLSAALVRLVQAVLLSDPSRLSRTICLGCMEEQAVGDIHRRMKMSK